MSLAVGVLQGTLNSKKKNHFNYLYAIIYHIRIIIEASIYC